MGLLTGTSAYSPGGTATPKKSTSYQTTATPRPPNDPDARYGRVEVTQPALTPEQIARGAYQYDYDRNQLALDELARQAALLGPGYNLQRDELGLRNAQNNAQLGVDNAYIGQREGFANQGAALARQLLGLDRQDIGIDREDYRRDWDLARWNLRADQTARGAFVTAGHRFKNANLEDKLRLANMGFDVEGKRVNVRDDQVGLNLAEQLAGLGNQRDQNAVAGKYGNALFQNANEQLAFEQAMKEAGYDADTAAALLERAQTDANVAALIGQIMAGRTSSGSTNPVAPYTGVSGVTGAGSTGGGGGGW